MFSSLWALFLVLIQHHQDASCCWGASLQQTLETSHSHHGRIQDDFDATRAKRSETQHQQHFFEQEDLTLAATDVATEMRMHVSIQQAENLQNAPSCMHSISHIEIINMHATESLVVHSMQLTTEETLVDGVRVSSLAPQLHLIDESGSSSTSTSGSSINEDQPQSSPPPLPLSEEEWTLGPGEVARVPLTLLPRFTVPERSTWSVAPSLAQATDVEDWLGTPTAVAAAVRAFERIKNTDIYINEKNSDYISSEGNSNTIDGVGYTSTIHANLLIDTQRGVLTVPIHASTIRQNAYGLPDQIIFASTRHIDAEEKSFGGMSSVTQSQPKPSDTQYAVVVDDRRDASWNGNFRPRHCFDVYMHYPGMDDENVNNEEVHHVLVEALVSQPTVMGLYVKGKRVHDNGADYENDAAVTKTDYYKSIPPLHHVVRSWSGYSSIPTTLPTGHLLLNATRESQYVVTVCRHDDISNADKSVTSMTANEQRYVEEVDTVKKVDSSELGFLELRFEHDSFYISLEEEFPRDRGIDFVTREQKAGDNISNVSSVAPRIRSARCFLGAEPTTLTFRFLSSSSPQAKHSLTIQNLHRSASIRLMRASIALHLTNQEWNEVVGLNVSITDLKAESIGPKAILSDAVTVQVAVGWDKLARRVLSDDRSFALQGSLIVRGTTQTSISYEEWEESMVRNLREEAEFVLEIAMTIHLVQGHISLVLNETSHPFPDLLSLKPERNNVQSISAAFFPMRRDDVRALMTDESDRKLLERNSLDHHFRVFSNRNFELRINTTSVVDTNDAYPPAASACQRFETTVLPPHGADTSHSPDLVDLGHVYLRYDFTSPDTSDDSSQNTTGPDLPTECYLRLRTLPDTGDHLTLLLVYSGMVEVSRSLSQSELFCESTNQTLSDAGKQVWHRVFVGFDKLMTWIQNSRFGVTMRLLLQSTWDSKKLFDSDGILLGQYLHSLSPFPASLKGSRLRPILLEVGAIEQGHVETLPLYFTNLNPVPVKISIDVGEVEGMCIAFGRDESTGRGSGQNILDYLPNKPTLSAFEATSEDRFTATDGLRRFLSSSEIAGSVVSQFQFKEAISMSHYAMSKPVLRKAYRETHTAVFYKDRQMLRHVLNESQRCDQSERPALYGTFEKSVRGKPLSGPIIMSNDGITGRRLPVCWDKASDGDGSHAAIPAGGVARFDITLRSPPISSLEKDITQFLASGLVLSSNHGEVMPILVTFEALKGKVEVSHLRGALDNYIVDAVDLGRVINVPVGLFQPPVIHNNSSWDIPPKNIHKGGAVTRRDILTRNASRESSIPLYMRSTFNRNLRLQRVSSCNPWFEVALNHESHNPEPDPFLGVRVGVVRSVVSCDMSDGQAGQNVEFPSYFRCALNWLVRRTDLQPRGCGLLPASQRRGDSEDGQLAERGRLDRAIRVFRRALSVTEFSRDDNVCCKRQPSMCKFACRSWDGTIPTKVVDIFAQAWDVWRSISELGLHVMSTSLRVEVEYNSTGREKSMRLRASRRHDDESHLLSLALHNLSILSVFETPTLLDVVRARELSAFAKQGDELTPSTIDFLPAYVAQVQALHIPLKNPTGIPIRVRLAVAPKNEPGVHSQTHCASEGVECEQLLRSNFMGSFSVPYVQHVGTSASTDPSDVANRHWWDGGGSYYLSDFNGDVIRSHHNVTIKAGRAGACLSLVNPSVLANSAFSVGCGSRCGIRDEAGKKSGDVLVDLRTSSPVGSSASAGTNLLGQTRRSTGEMTGLHADDSFIQAGASLLTISDGPSAFAIPFSSLGEVVISPFGEAVIGPILFRPPGRSEHLGCEPPFTGNVPAPCGIRDFESMILLDNSLTGIERIAIRAKAHWERVIFLDEGSATDADGFGDIELRNGRTTLMFSGSGQKEGGVVKPAVKTILVQNDGNVPVRFSDVFFSFSDVNYVHFPLDYGRNCEQGGFRILNCSDENFVPFELLPGENRSLTVEHLSLCNMKSQFVTMILLHDREGRQAGLSNFSDAQNPLYTRKTTKAKELEGKRRKFPFMKQREELLIGYSMTEAAFNSCSPVSPAYTQPSDGVKFNNQTRWKRNTAAQEAALNLALIVCAFLAGCSFTLHLCKQRIGSTLLSSVKNVGSRDFQTNWLAAFRCLARVNPTPSDLYAIGREQVRHTVLAKYASIGVLSPQCFNSAGYFQRDRLGHNRIVRRQSIPIKQRGGNQSGNDRIRTLSDAIFRQYVRRNTALGSILPCGLGWQNALTRNVIDGSTLSKSPVVRTSEALQQRRSEHSLDEAEDAGYEISILTNGSDDESEYETFHASGEDFMMNSSDKLSSSDKLNILDEQRYEQSNANIGEELHDPALDTTPSAATYKNEEATEVCIPDEPGTAANDLELSEHHISVAGSDSVKPNEHVRASIGTLTFDKLKEEQVNRQESGSSSSTTKALEVSSLELGHLHSEISNTVKRTSKGRKRTGKRMSTETHKCNSESRKVADTRSSRVVSRSDNGSSLNSTPSSYKKEDTLTPSPRVPPGLAPPPGFGKTPESPVASATERIGFNLTTPEPIHSAAVIMNSRRTNALENSGSMGSPFTSVLSLSSCEHFLRNDHTGTPSHASYSSLEEAVPPWLGTLLPDPGLHYDADAEADAAAFPMSADTGFDVVDFLDGVLNDGCGDIAVYDEDDNEEEEDDEDEERGDDGMDGVIEQVPDPSAAVAALVSANPWAPEKRRSRAAQYGISFDADDSERSMDPLIIPLLTPAVILAQEKSSTLDNNATTTKEPPRRDASFYSNLLGEE